MTASFQTPGPLPPETSPIPAVQPVPLYESGLGSVAVPSWRGNPDVPHRLRSPFPEPDMPACCTCGTRAGDAALRPDPRGRRYESGAQVLYCGPCTPGTPATAAAAAVIDATMRANDGASGEQLAEAERQAGILFDAASVDAAVSAARAQAQAEADAELAELRGQLAAMAGAYRQRQAVLRLCEGRKGDDLLLVSAVAVAAECGTTALDDLPMTLTWTRSADVPADRDLAKRVTVHCESSFGGRANLVVDGDDRRALASMLDAELVRDIHDPCPHAKHCGTAEELDPSDPALFGWARLEVAGIDGGPRWYCSAGCIFKAVARAGEELAAVDDLDARYGPGASEEYLVQVAEAIADAFDDHAGEDDATFGDGGQ